VGGYYTRDSKGNLLSDQQCGLRAPPRLFRRDGHAHPGRPRFHQSTSPAIASASSARRRAFFFPASRQSAIFSRPGTERRKRPIVKLVASSASQKTRACGVFSSPRPSSSTPHCALKKMPASPIPASAYARRIPPRHCNHPPGVRPGLPRCAIAHIWLFGDAVNYDLSASVSSPRLRRIRLLASRSSPPASTAFSPAPSPSAAAKSASAWPRAQRQQIVSNLARGRRPAHRHRRSRRSRPRAMPADRLLQSLLYGVTPGSPSWPSPPSLCPCFLVLPLCFPQDAPPHRSHGSHPWTSEPA